MASTPRPCAGDEDERKEMLVLIAHSANNYYLQKGKLPGMWSSEMSDIVSKVSNARKFGNIIPQGEHKIRMICSILDEEGNYSQHHNYYIEMKTFTITELIQRVKKIYR